MGCIRRKPHNVGVEAAADDCATDKLSIRSALIPLASNDLFDGRQGVGAGILFGNSYMNFKSISMNKINSSASVLDINAIS